MAIWYYMKIRSRVDRRKVLTVLPSRDVVVAMDRGDPSQLWAVFGGAGLFTRGWQLVLARSLGGDPSPSTASSWMVLDVRGASTEDHGQVQVFLNHRGDNQTWDLRSVGNRYWELVCNHSGKALDIRGGAAFENAQVQQFTNHHGPNQQWEFVIASRMAESYSIQPLSARGKVVDLRGSADLDGAAVQIYHWHGGQNQWWRPQPLHEPLVGPESHYFLVASKSNSRVLDIARASTADKALLQLYHRTGGTNQQWEFIQTGFDDVFAIQNRNSGKVLDVPGGATDDGTQIQQFTDHGGENQRFRLFPYAIPGDIPENPPPTE